MNRKKRLKTEYKLSSRTMGVYQILNLENEKRFIGSSLNLDGILNRHRFELDAGLHRNKPLQDDFILLGKERFVFEVLEELPSRTDPDYDYATDLECLENLWLEKLRPYNEAGYNEKKLSRDERLWKIAAARNSKLENRI